jgi:hypothetical protein
MDARKIFIKSFLMSSGPDYGSLPTKFLMSPLGEDREMVGSLARQGQHLLSAQSGHKMNL